MLGLGLLALAEPWLTPRLSQVEACRAAWLAGVPFDPWGWPWRQTQGGIDGSRLLTYSSGPNCEDERLAGDDVLVGGPVRSWREHLLVPPAVMAWLLLASARRGPARWREVLRVAALTAIPTAAVWLLLGARRDHPYLELYLHQPGLRLLPPAVGISASVAGFFLLAASLLRLRRAPDPDGPKA